MAFPDFLRGMASQLIVWHHLAFYGPLSDIAYPLAPATIDWLFDYGRMAVQVFFVVGGFFTARSLARGPALDPSGLATAVWRRYRRIGIPYLVTLALAVAANALARRWMDHSSISAPPTLDQLLAHAFFLQNVLGYEALTAGIWYLAIDFQLGLLVLLVTAGCARAARTRLGARLRIGGEFALVQYVLWPLAAASLFAFNRRPELDVWAIYFFGSFFCGMVLEWTLSGRLPRGLFWAYLGLMGAAAAVDWRPRLVVSASTALAMWLAARAGLLSRWPRGALVEFLGRISYSLFLVHFPVCLVVNAWFSSRGAGELSPASALAGLFIAYALSLAAAVLFHRAVESRFQSAPKAARAAALAGPADSRPPEAPGGQPG